MPNVVKPTGPTQNEVFNEMLGVEGGINTALHTLRRLRAEAPTEVMQAYGGKDYPRQFSLGITRIEEGLLWLGQVVEESMQDPAGG